MGLKSLEYYLLGQEFDLETDKKAFSWINTTKICYSRIFLNACCSSSLSWRPIFLRVPEPDKKKISCALWLDW